MKKLILLFIALTLILSIVACAPTDSATTPSINTEQNTTSSVQDTTSDTTGSGLHEGTFPSINGGNQEESRPTESEQEGSGTNETIPPETKPTDPKPTQPRPTDPPHTHQHTENKRVEPSCTKDGYIIMKCECGDTLHQTLPKVEHNYSKTERKEPTCELTGFIKHLCECGAAQVETLPKKEHQYTQTKTIPATCTSNGKKIQSCVCGTSLTTSIPKIEHQYKETGRTAPSCTKEGKITYTCACGKTRSESIAKLQHNYKLTSTTESTTTVQGTKVYTCTSCSASYTEKLPLKPSAKDTDMCGPSLLNKPMRHAPYYDIVSQLFERINQKPTMSESQKMGVIPVTDDIAMKTFWTWWNDTYKYAAYMYWYTSYKYDDPAKEDGFLIWGDEDIWAEESAVHAEVYRILAELKIDSSVTQKEAITRINNYLCENRYYQYDESKRDGSVYHSIFADNGVCHNYSLAFQLLCLGAGIECQYYSSDTMNHGWNKVYFSDGSYYWVDVTWNDVRYIVNGKEVETSVENGVSAAKVKELRSRYLLITTEQLLKDHSM